CALGYVWWSAPARLHVLTRYLPLPPDPQLVDAQTSAEYLRRRVAEEQRDIQLRAEEAAGRVARFQAEPALGAADAPDSHTRADGTLEQVQARSALATHLSELTERHIFSSRPPRTAYA